MCWLVAADQRLEAPEDSLRSPFLPATGPPRPEASAPAPLRLQALGGCQTAPGTARMRRGKISAGG